MCGVAGVLDLQGAMSRQARAAACRAMGDALVHRGPDDGGVWVSPDSGVGFAHRRLSILDLSPLGHQPMTSASGRHVITFNGEIYNFAALRSELTSYPFQSRSDTEVLLAAFDAWGVERTLPRLQGMFALGVWDARDRALWLARDRFGEKPLYYGTVAGSVVFGSELSAIRAFPGFGGAIDRGALTAMLRLGYVPTPASIYEGIRKLPPATSLRIAAVADVGAPPRPYWSLAEVAARGLAHPYRGSEAEAAEALDARLRAAVGQQMVSDVPLGAFLSGGIDSSTVVAMMQATSTRRVKTFTIGFREAGFNEAEWARRVAAHLGTDHTELYVEPEDARAVIPKLPELYSEPFADSSQIPTFLVAELARRSVTVALSGDGGDELFGGYNRYTLSDALWRYLRLVPLPARARASGALRFANKRASDLAAHARLSSLRPPFQAHLLDKIADVLPLRSLDEVYLRMISRWRAPSLLTGVDEPHHPLLTEAPAGIDGGVARMMWSDAVTYLPDDILAKVDRAAMGVSLETRVPFLDPSVAELAWSFPPHYKLRGGKGKLVLRRLLARYLPRSLFERPKMGFGVPLGSWLRGPLRGWAEGLLDERRMRADGLLRPEPIRAAWTAFLEGTGAAETLWTVLMFQAWRAAPPPPSRGE